MRRYFQDTIINDTSGPFLSKALTIRDEFWVPPKSIFAPDTVKLKYDNCPYTVLLASSLYG